MDIKHDINHTQQDKLILWLVQSALLGACSAAFSPRSSSHLFPIISVFSSIPSWMHRWYVPVVTVNKKDIYVL